MLCTWGVGGANWVLPGASVDLDFAHTAYFPQPVDSAITTTRASTGYAQTSSGLLVPFASNIPRITDQGLLIEEARTNLCTQSAFGGAVSTPWALFGTTITTNAATAPDNTVTSALLKEDSSASFHRIGTTTSIATAASTTYTFSLFAKTGPGSKRWLWINPNFSGGGSVVVTVDLTDGTTSGISGSPTVVTKVLGGFVFIAVTFTTSVGTTSTDLRIGLNNAVGAAASYTGDGTSGNYVWGARLEAGSFATSYIPTTTVAVTRALDSEAAASGLLTALQAPSGTVIVSLNNGIAGVAGTILGLNSLIGLGKTSGDALTTAFGGAQTSGNTATWTGPVKAGLRWTPSSVGVVLNGGAIVSAANTPPAVTAGYLGSTSGSSAAINQFIKRLTVFPTSLADSQMQALTT